MGVHNLWKLLSRFAEPTHPEEWRGKRVAIDASIWITQLRSVAEKNVQSDLITPSFTDLRPEVQTAVIEGFLYRVAQLIYYEISPVFVFDGHTPEIKRRETARRRKARDDLERARLKSVSLQVLRARLEQKVNELRRSGVLKDDNVSVMALISQLTRVQRNAEKRAREEKRTSNNVHNDTVPGGIKSSSETSSPSSKDLEATFEAPTTSSTLSVSSNDHSLHLPFSNAERKRALMAVLQDGAASLRQRESLLNAARFNRVLATSDGRPDFLGFCRSAKTVSDYIGPRAGLEAALEARRGAVSKTFNQLDVLELCEDDPGVSVILSDSEKCSQEVDCAELVEEASNEEEVRLVSSTGEFHFPLGTIERGVETALLQSNNEKEDSPHIMNINSESDASCCTQDSDRDSQLTSSDKSSSSRSRDTLSNFIATEASFSCSSAERTASVSLEKHRAESQDNKSSNDSSEEEISETDRSFAIHPVTRIHVLGPSGIAPPEEYFDVAHLLELCGVPFLVAPEEADTQCAWMCRSGMVDAVLSEDSDMLVRGAPVVVRGFFTSEKRRAGRAPARPVEVFRLDRLGECGLTSDVLKCLALILGCDYCGGVPGVGLSHALRAVAATWPLSFDSPVETDERGARVLARAYRTCLCVQRIHRLYTASDACRTTTQHSLTGGVQDGMSLLQLELLRTVPRGVLRAFAAASDSFPSLAALEAFFTDCVVAPAGGADSFALRESNIVELLKFSGLRSVSTHVTSRFMAVVRHVAERKAKQVGQIDSFFARMGVKQPRGSYEEVLSRKSEYFPPPSELFDDSLPYKKELVALACAVRGYSLQHCVRSDDAAGDASQIDEDSLHGPYSKEFELVCDKLSYSN